MSDLAEYVAWAAALPPGGGEFPPGRAVAWAGYWGDLRDARLEFTRLGLDDLIIGAYTSADPVELAAAAAHAEWLPRAVVAANPACPLDVLAVLAVDPSPWVRAFAAAMAPGFADLPEDVHVEAWLAG